MEWWGNEGEDEEEREERRGGEIACKTSPNLAYLSVWRMGEKQHFQQCESRRPKSSTVYNTRSSEECTWQLSILSSETGII